MAANDGEVQSDSKWWKTRDGAGEGGRDNDFNEK